MADAPRARRLTVSVLPADDLPVDAIPAAAPTAADQMVREMIAARATPRPPHRGAAFDR
jgi:hypothetical protein